MVTDQRSDCSIIHCVNSVSENYTKCDECNKKICLNCSINLINYCSHHLEYYVKCPMCNLQHEILEEHVKNIFIQTNTLFKKIPVCGHTGMVISIEENEEDELKKDLVMYFTKDDLYVHDNDDYDNSLGMIN